MFYPGLRYFEPKCAMQYMQNAENTSQMQQLKLFQTHNYQ